MAYDAGVKDIAELRQFGTKLNQAAEACTNLFQHLNAETHRICDSWNDDKASRFMQTFEERKREIDRLSQEMREFSAYISRLAQAAEDYRNVRKWLWQI